MPENQRYAIPIVDQQPGVWQVFPSGSLSSVLDETTAQDGDRIQAHQWGAPARLTLSPVTNPNTLTGHQMRYRGWGDFQVTLYCGSTRIAYWTEHLTAMTTVTHDLTPEQVLWIEDYTQLWVELTVGDGS